MCSDWLSLLQLGIKGRAQGYSGILIVMVERQMCQNLDADYTQVWGLFLDFNYEKWGADYPWVRIVHGELR